MTSTQYRVVGLGGTFDHFHKGHEQFILFAANLATHLQIGITTPKLIQRKPLAELCESYEIRSKAVVTFCKKRRISCAIIPLQNVYGPTLKNSSIEALCVTKETIPGSKRINRARIEHKLPPLPIHVCGYYLNKLGHPIHSQDIRAGSVNRRGKVYELLLKKTLLLTQSQLQFLAKPQGAVKKTLVSSIARNAFLVGDATLEFFLLHNLPYKLGIYDKKINRVSTHSPIINSIHPEIITKNRPGSISRSLTKSLKLALLGRTKHIFVQGEEDLAAVALVLLLPLGATIYYGQPGQGIVTMKVTEEKKETLASLLNPNITRLNSRSGTL
ncbi:MAG: pantetheine-phosphate adenylyltransferase [bacterium]|nr:pantetheine-phosphate adenylyltransferase [bacterium]